MDKRASVIGEGKWAARNINGTLRHESDITHAVNALTMAQLPLHPDRPKNWDQLLALYSAVGSCSREDPVLDAGACPDGAFLPALAQCGFESLTGCNIDREKATHYGARNPIRYDFGDVHELPYPTNTFKFVACLSVIEHGVRWCEFITEMHRVIRPGGFLFVSTDYWPEKIDGGGQQAFGAPVRVFDGHDIQGMLSVVSNLFSTDGTPDIDSYEKTVHWLGMDYTFINMLLRRR